MKRSQIKELVKLRVLQFLKNKQTGGISESESIGDKFIDSLSSKAGVDPEQLRMGIQVEKEHETTLGTSDIRVLAKIAIDHLREVPDYYTKLKSVEQSAKSIPEEREMDEVSASGAIGVGAGPIQTPKAFQKGKDSRSRRRGAQTSGMKIIGDMDS